MQFTLNQNELNDLQFALDEAMGAERPTLGTPDGQNFIITQEELDLLVEQELDIYEVVPSTADQLVVLRNDSQLAAALENTGFDLKQLLALEAMGMNIGRQSTAEFPEVAIHEVFSEAQTQVIVDTADSRVDVLRQEVASNSSNPGSPTQILPLTWEEAQIQAIRGSGNDVEFLTVTANYYTAQVKRIAKSLGLSQSGTKSAIAQRIIDDLNENSNI